MLLDNSRRSYNAIANSLGVSINTIRARVDKMLMQGLIRYHTIINLERFGYYVIYLLIKDCKDIDGIMEKVRLIANVIMIVRCIGDTFVIGMVSKDKNAIELIKALLEPYASIELLSYKEPLEIRLSRSSRRIVRYLIDNPRARNKDIAYKLDISEKTVKRNLDLLLSNDVIKFSIILNPSRLKAFINFGLIIRFDDDIMDKVCSMLQEHMLMSPIIYEHTMIAILYGDTMYSIDEDYRRIRSMDGVKAVELVIPLDITIDHRIIKDMI